MTSRIGMSLALLLASTGIAGCSQNERSKSESAGFSNADNRDRQTAAEAAAAAAQAASEAAGAAAMQESVGIQAPRGAAMRDSDMPPAVVTPGISPAGAPGVAFSYRYAFVLPDTAIAAVQEQHASACEKLGPTQCRIIGMRYTLIDENQVEAFLQLKLAPEIARGFGKDGIAAVGKANGKLVDALIEGNDVGSQITSSRRRSAELQDELSRIERQLAASGLGQSERFALQQQAERLRAQLAAESKGRDDSEELLAQTPMVFTYAGEQGFTLGSDPIGDAASGAWSSFAFIVSTILLALGYGVPWLLLGAVLLLAWRSRFGRMARGWLRPGRRNFAGNEATAEPGDAPVAE